MFDRWSKWVLFVRLFVRFIFRVYRVIDTCQVGIIGRAKYNFNFGSNFELSSILMIHVTTFVVGRKHLHSFCQRRFKPILWLLPGLFRHWVLAVPINILFWFGIGSVSGFTFDYLIWNKKWQKSEQEGYYRGVYIRLCYLVIGWHMLNHMKVLQSNVVQPWAKCWTLMVRFRDKTENL